MSENLSGAQRAVHPPGHPNAGTHCTNSGTGIIVCCYINALGKVLRKGQPGDSERFKTFVRECMPDFLNAGSTRSLPPTPRRQVGGEYWLYEVYRCGFVHAFYPDRAAWGRSRSARYWLKNNPPTLNIDRLVRGFNDGLVVFRRKAEDDPDLRANFKRYITA
jgi:hypothetical protein